MSLARDNEYEWKIVKKSLETPDTYTYSFSPATSSQRFSFTVGQSVVLSVMLRRPTKSGQDDVSLVQRAYSIASSPYRDIIDLTIKDEKPYGYINPVSGKADGFAAYFFEQIKIGDKVRVRPNINRHHFLWKIADGIERDIAYWSGANGAESARSLLQFMEDTKKEDMRLTLFYSNPHLYQDNEAKFVNVIYYDWLIQMAKKMENFQVIFNFTKDQEIQPTDHTRVTYRKGRFFLDEKGKEEKTLSRYHGNSEAFNPICGSSGFINGTVRLPDGRIERKIGIMQNLTNIEGVKPEKIDKEQYYLDLASTK